MHFSRWGNKEDLEGNHDRVNRSLFNCIYIFLNKKQSGWNSKTNMQSSEHQREGSCKRLMPYV